MGTEKFGKPSTAEVTILAGQSLSDELDLYGNKIIGLIMPDGWDVADIYFSASDVSGGTFVPVYDDSGAETKVIGPVAGRAIGIDVIAGVLAAFRFLKIRSGPSGAPVNQTADRTIKLVMKV